jgi:hypothetical protein
MLNIFIIKELVKLKIKKFKEIVGMPLVGSDENLLRIRMHLGGFKISNLWCGVH